MRSVSHTIRIFAAVSRTETKKSSNISRLQSSLFQHCETGAVTEYRDIEETISTQVLEKMVLWLSEFK